MRIIRENFGTNEVNETSSNWEYDAVLPLVLRVSSIRVLPEMWYNPDGVSYVIMT